MPVTNLFGEKKIVQFVCVDTTGASRVNQDDVIEICRLAGFECEILVSYSENGYSTAETNRELKEALVNVLGRELDSDWQPEKKAVSDDGGA